MKLPNKRQWQRREPRSTKSMKTRTASRSKATTEIIVNPNVKQIQAPQMPNTVKVASL